MDVVVVYESQFGNTRLIAEDIAAGVKEAEPEAQVAVLSVTEATPERIGDAALIVGGPTHALGLSKPSTRRKAREAGEKATATESGTGSAADAVGIREWLDTLPSQVGRMAAAFDTRLPSRLAGGAASRIARRLRRRGYVVTGSHAFIVKGTDGPLRTGEREKAKAWGASLPRQLRREPT